MEEIEVMCMAKTLKQIMSWSDAYTDEVQVKTGAVGYANTAISRINTKFNLKLPFITDIEEEYSALDDSWFVLFMTNYLSYGIKMNDGSLSEAREYKQNFEQALYDFEGVDKSTVISEVYLGDGSPMYQMDTSSAIDIGWFYHGNYGTGER